MQQDAQRQEEGARLHNSKDDGQDETPSLEGSTILLVLPALETGGGIERAALSFAQGVIAAGGRAVLASAPGDLVFELKALGGRHVALPAPRPWTRRRAIRELRRAIHTYKVDIIHCCSCRVARVVKPVAAVERCAWVSSVHSFLDSVYGFGRGQPLRRLIIWLIYRRYNKALLAADRVVAISPFMAELLRRAHGFDQDDRLRVVQRGIDTQVFHAENISSGRLVAQAQAWGLRDGVPVILMPARINWTKGHRLLVEALALLTDLEWHCMLVGRPSNRRQLQLLRTQIAHRRMTTRISFGGVCKDMPAAYKLASVVVCPSARPEAFGCVICEAQATGRVVVATAHGAALQQISDGVSGFLSQPGDHKSLAEALRRALTLAVTQRNAMTEVAVRSSRRFTQERMTAQMCAVYRELYDQKVGRASD